MSEPQTFDFVVYRGCSLDESIAVATDGGDPMVDGSFVIAEARQAPGDVEPALAFDSRDPLRALTIDGWDAAQHRMALSFRASRATILAIPAGVYAMPMIHARPRPGPFGDKYDCVGVIQLEVR